MKFSEYALCICSILISVWTAFGIEGPSCAKCTHVSITLPKGVPPYFQLLVRKLMIQAKLENAACEREISNVSRVSCDNGASSKCMTQYVSLSGSHVLLFSRTRVKATVISRSCVRNSEAVTGQCIDNMKREELTPLLKTYLESVEKMLTAVRFHGKMCFKNPLLSQIKGTKI